MMIPYVKALQGVLWIVAVAAIFGAGWHTGGSGCREKVATARAEHAEQMREKEAQIAAERAAIQVEIARREAMISDSVRALVKDKAECSYEAGYIDYINSLR